MTCRLFRQRTLLIGCFGLVCLIASRGFGANLAVDPGFELGTPSGPVNTGGWNFANGAVLNTTAANAHSGSKSVNLTNGGGGVSANVPLAFETFNTGVAPGAQFTLTGFGLATGPMAPAGASNNNTSFAGIQATFFSGADGTGTNLGTVATGPGNAQFSNHIDSNSPVGVQIPLSTGVFTAPAGAQSMQIFAIAVFPQMVNAGTGVFVDDLELTAVPEPASVILLGAGLFGLGAVAVRRSRNR